MSEAAIFEASVCVTNSKLEFRIPVRGFGKGPSHRNRSFFFNVHLAPQRGRYPAAGARSAEAVRLIRWLELLRMFDPDRFPGVMLLNGFDCASQHLLTLAAKWVGKTSQRSTFQILEIRFGDGIGAAPNRRSVFFNSTQRVLQSLRSDGEVDHIRALTFAISGADRRPLDWIVGHS